jgi:hypothetical protein
MCYGKERLVAERLKAVLGHYWQRHQISRQEVQPKAQASAA